ncbi:MATE family efflux transporter [Tissierella pigra]|uniref:Probable multidrug resistance protein NorM n=1 Tax=Tissierella pigra TaxID=2607614 RepID=A0A6N7XX42_9FIRM|nr:MATE family efflux transporter [Tissierella pigra]MBU5424924.1 MATE family efflux transporter [Tissierella pigra]MSU01134.1 MATE family efflux transporter [Tissierella pigra]
MITDMTRGNPTKTLIAFTFPMLIGNLFQQLYNIVDSVVVGRYVGKNALAAVGSSFMLMNFFSFVIIGLCMGAAVVYSYYFGERNYSNLRKTIFISFSSIGIFTIVLSIILVFTTKGMLNLINTPEEIFLDSQKYLQTIFAGLIFVYLYNACSALLRSIGDSKTPLYFLILAAIINIVLDLLFVIVYDMGVFGVAFATVIAQGVSSILCLIYGLWKIEFIRLKKEDLVFDKGIFAMVSKFSFLTSIQQSIMTFGMVCVQGIVNTFGSDTIAAFTAAGKVDSIAYLPVQDFGNAFGTYVAQNKGAKKNDRIIQGVKSAIKTIIIFCLIMSIIIYMSSSSLMRIFVEASEVNVIKLGVEYLSIISVFYVLIGFLFMFYGFFRGIGELNISLILTIISLGTRVLMAYILSSIPSIAQRGIWWSVPIGWALADGIGFILYRRTKHKKLLIEEDSPKC